jgi:hypothetical protein
MLARAMRDWFPGFNWPDLIAVVILMAVLYALVRWADDNVTALLALAPLAVIVAYVVFRRWRQPIR